ncbi:hypothetical protein HYX09_01165, partial [Candidatus Woesearchaeota archaeon]|nr:hypothetical protein [Candidatus Woesearchaeota archaeon]
GMAPFSIILITVILGLIFPEFYSKHPFIGLALFIALVLSFINVFIQAFIQGGKIEEAAKFRLKMKKRNISMTDCIGYVISGKLKVKFLTGDKEFEHLPNVEFVK